MLSSNELTGGFQNAQMKEGCHPPIHLLNHRILCMVTGGWTSRHTSMEGRGNPRQITDLTQGYHNLSHFNSNSTNLHVFGHSEEIHKDTWKEHIPLNFDK